MLAETYPVTLACDLLGVSRSSYYYRPVESPGGDGLRAALKQVAAEWPTYGYRRLTQQLRRQGWQVNAKRVQRLMRSMGLLAQTKRRKQHTTNSRHGFRRYPNLVLDLEIECPEQVWVCDLTYIRLRGDFVYLALIMDVFTRGIRGWQLGRTLDQSLSVIALQRALAHHPAPAIHHSDQGIQYATGAYTQLLEQANVRISMAEVGQAWQNGYAERLIRTIKEEEVDLAEYRDYHDAYQQIGHFLDDVYMYKRIHSSLGYLTPAEFEAQWRAACPGP